MDDNAPKENPPENPPADFNKLDLSQLQGFSFGTQWTQEKPSSGRREDDRPRREGSGPERRDRRTFRRPAGGPGEGGGPAGGPGGGMERRDFGGDRRGGPRREGGGDFRGPRREGYGAGPRFGRGGPQDRDMRGPYDSPYYSVTFYPEDTSFNTLVQTIRKTCRTVELFEIARTVVAKPDRFVVVLAHKPAAESSAPAASAQPGAPAAPVAPRAKKLFHIAVPDGMPFESDDAAVAYVLSKHLDKFFETAEVEVEPPKGNFQVINKCGITGELLGPPNYHRYNQIVQQHYAAKLAGRMSLEAFRSRIETIRDPEVVNQWLAKMKKTTRYTWKTHGRSAEAGKPAPAEAKPVEAPAAEPQPTEAPTAESAPTEPAAEQPPAETPAPAAPAARPVPTFDTLEDARVFLLTQARDKVVRTAEHARFHGKLFEQMPPGEIRRAIEGAWERQRRFPLDTANALRGRLRREHFTIFKKGSKGISYVCAVKRKFRVPGQTFADSIGALIAFIETHPMIRAGELPEKLLGINLPPPPPKPVEAAASPAAIPGEGAPAETSTGGEAAKPAEPAAAPGPILTIDERARIARMQGDLMWLVREGYVTEFIDGRLFAPPPMVEARKKEVEAEEHDPENFPEAPPSETPAAAPQSESEAPAEAAAPTEEPAGATSEAMPSPTGTEPPAETAPAATPAETSEPAAPPPAEEKPAS